MNTRLRQLIFQFYIHMKNLKRIPQIESIMPTLSITLLKKIKSCRISQTGLIVGNEEIKKSIFMPSSFSPFANMCNQMRIITEASWISNVICAISNSISLTPWKLLFVFNSFSNRKKVHPTHADMHKKLWNRKNRKPFILSISRRSYQWHITFLWNHRFIFFFFVFTEYISECGLLQSPLLQEELFACNGNNQKVRLKLEFFCERQK